MYDASLWMRREVRKREMRWADSAGLTMPVFGLIRLGLKRMKVYILFRISEGRSRKRNGGICSSSSSSSSKLRRPPGSGSRVGDTAAGPIIYMYATEAVWCVRKAFERAVIVYFNLLRSYVIR